MLFHFKSSKKGPSPAGFVVGVLFTVIGVTAMIPAMGFIGVLWTLMGLGIAVVNGIGMFGKKSDSTAARTGEPEQPPEPLSDREKERIKAAREYAAQARQRIVSRIHEEDAAETHDHIPSTALGPEKRLEQLKTLKDAGLIDEKEYAGKRKQILEEV